MTGDAALYSVANGCFADRHLQSDKLSYGKRSRVKPSVDDLGKAIKSAITVHKETILVRQTPGTVSNVWGMDPDMEQPALTEVTNGLVFRLSKVRSALEMRKYIILAGPVSFIDKSDHRFMWCGAGVRAWRRGRSVSQFGP